MKGYSITIPAITDDYALAVNQAAGLIASGTGSFAADYAAGIATVTINGVTASRVLKAGSVLRVPGHSGEYRVSSDVTASAGGVLTDVALLPASGLQKAVTSGSAVLIDQVRLPLDAGKASGVYRHGIEFTVAGDATVYRFETTVTATAGGDLGDVPFSPPLAMAVADNAVVTVLPPTLTNAADGAEGHVTFQVSGIAGGAVLTSEGTIDGTNWFGVGVVPTTSTTMATTINADGAFRMDATGLAQTRLRVSTAGTGTITVRVAPAMY